MKSYTQFERRKYILDELEKYNRVMVNDLAKALNVTTETIRRDLDMMHKEGKLTKIHGGAVKKKDHTIEFYFDKRRSENIEEKRKIAMEASKLVEDNDIIAIEIGTTTMQILDFIHDKKNLTILTNSIPAVNKVIELKEQYDSFDCKLIVFGGMLNSNSLALSGDVMLNYLDHFTVNKLFASCDGISLEKELTCSYIEDAQVFQQLKKNAKQVVMMIDESKFNLTKFYKSGNFDDIDALYTNAKLDEVWQNVLISKGIEVITV
ncbi:DeoR/GlpR family DNA-binding transcription regulator [Bacillus sp. DX1.1]|uniref:DeoR/GlpR family DNA-binding transcription regulator n=1 Tax=unclassified Bacillus (in: firmicutes) TaxID=185979 RepID=UPI0025702336|nr:MULTISPECIES: DeoR/GlpR family DNA-binding transcription regulator [unclassified Bacillus (in: firmicutes)]MDM5153386.1 DeoR/GlpR family DNA-binding transcription regulator [Bacillus sp. DX1.1]WJE82343.1 DeoR/GlpR family DNA-binding transcription regulator [Bacillus sp. DX3.1]